MGESDLWRSVITVSILHCGLSHTCDCAWNLSSWRFCVAGDLWAYHESCHAVWAYHETCHAVWAKPFTILCYSSKDPLSYEMHYHLHLKLHSMLELNPINFTALIPFIVMKALWRWSVDGYWLIVLEPIWLKRGNTYWVSGLITF